MAHAFDLSGKCGPVDAVILRGRGRMTAPEALRAGGFFGGGGCGTDGMPGRMACLARVEGLAGWGVPVSARAALRPRGWAAAVATRGWRATRRPWWRWPHGTALRWPCLRPPERDWPPRHRSRARASAAARRPSGWIRPAPGWRLGAWVMSAPPAISSSVSGRVGLRLGRIRISAPPTGGYTSILEEGPGIVVFSGRMPCGGAAVSTRARSRSRRGVRPGGTGPWRGLRGASAGRAKAECRAGAGR